MDFFDRQDYARRQTARLLILFGLAVVVIIAAIYLVLAVGIAGADHRHAQSAWPLWNPLLLAWVVLGTLLVVGVGSLYKVAELSAGGKTVALLVGGRAINPQTSDLAERRLLNVVEEMALASGIPVPPVYVLDQEPGINAFAAGYRPHDAVVTVSRGCLQYLTREELQGVIGHEFSHILNGDMRLNLRLVGIVFGILVLAVIGYYIIRSAPYLSSPGSRKQNNAAGIFVLGLTLLVFGYLGVLLGKIIKSAISRQREFLADASSVQFTRDPAGIAGALKKIGGLAEGSRIRDAHAEEISHMFFGDAFAGSLLNLFATHPPLLERIRRWEPDFDGHFPPVTPVAISAETLQTAAPVPPGASPALRGVMALDAGRVAQPIGRPQPEHLEHAQRMIGGIPPPLLEAAREPYFARAVIYGLLLSREDETVRGRQWQILQAQIEPPLYRQMQSLAELIQSLPMAARLPLVDLSTATLKRLSPRQYADFRRVVQSLLDAEGTLHLFEYCLRIVLFGYLDLHFGLRKPPAVRYSTVNAVAQPVVLVLSTLAYVGQKRPEDVQRAFHAGAQGLLGEVAMTPAPQCVLRNFDSALAELAQTAPAVKRDILTAAAACIAADGQVTPEEGELLRAIAATLGCPLPPLAAGAAVE